FEDPLGGPPVDSVCCDLHLQHPVRDVFAHARTEQARLTCSTLERLELAPTLVDSNDPSLRLELRLDVGVLVLAGDLADPAARMVANDEDDELGVVAARFGEDAQLRAGLGRDERAELAANARPAACNGLRHNLAVEPEREARVGRDLDRRSRRNARR